MACQPLTPTSEYIYDSGWVSSSTSIHTSALAQGEAPYAEVFTLPSVFSSTAQNVQVVQFAIRENANTTAVKGDLQALIYTTSAPTTPTAGAAYNGSTTNLLGSVAIATADYDRIAATVWEAVIQPNTYITTASSAGNETNAYVVLTANAAATYASGDTHQVRMWVKQNEAVATS